LIRAAERLFAEQGIDSVSMRQIGEAARMRMAGTVAYHFGDKDGLIRAIIEDRDARIDERRGAMLAALERQGLTHDLRAVAEAGIRPAVDYIGETGHFFRFIAQLDRHPTALSDALASGAFGFASRILELQVEAAVDHLPPMILEHRKRLGIHMIVGALADLEAQARGPVDEVVMFDLVDSVVALYSEPPSRQAHEALRRT